jgi:Holliday junction DNA helicase RuvA
MIAFLRGKLLEKHPNQIVIDTAGVGYEVVIPISTFSALPDAGAEVALRIHTHVREDALALFGFLTSEEKALFEKLISVSGIGPALAIKVLSGLAAITIIDAIRGGHVEQLVRIPGVGKKTAERMVLELKDKLEGLGGGGAVPAVSSRSEPALSAIEHDVLSALLNLGCQRAAAEAAVRKAKAGDSGSTFEPLFRKALELVR